MICSAFQQQCSFPLCVITAQAANIPPWILRAVPLAKVIIPPQPRSLVVNIRWIPYYLIKDFICSPGSAWTLWTLFSPPTLNFPATSCTRSPIQFSDLEWLTRLSRMESDLSRTSYSRHHLTASTDSALMSLQLHSFSPWFSSVLAALQRDDLPDPVKTAVSFPSLNWQFPRLFYHILFSQTDSFVWYLIHVWLF